MYLSAQSLCVCGMQQMGYTNIRSDAQVRYNLSDFEIM